MNIAEELFKLIDEHTKYCEKTYQPNKENNYSEVVLDLQKEMKQSLTHFSIFLERKVKNNDNK